MTILSAQSLRLAVFVRTAYSEREPKKIFQHFTAWSVQHPGKSKNRFRCVFLIIK
ncbi:MAG TPA: hypothetical protein PLZ12_21285 [Saprospiraceae bacterium]|jgi:hypothetical protein|nr:hypothetical protein [Saprospiraceae bacterium]HRK83990.1 hypothetical protein [Saprospiraceae bacterium]